MKFIKQLPNVREIESKFSLTKKQKEDRKNRIEMIQNILSGGTRKKILCIGPCSADREDAVIDYVLKISKLQEKVKDKFLVVPRIYTSKPRTNGTGYKGLLHRPTANSTYDDLLAGVIAVRKMHLHVVQETGLFCADEMLYPESIYYILDILAYVSIGARSVEDQGHRLTASGLELPVGMKNPTSGDFSVLINSITAAQYPQSLIYRGWEVQTEGNQYAHAILRGYKDAMGKNHPNYHYEDLCDLHDRYKKADLKNMSVIIDCNHANSDKRYDEQVRIAREVMNNCKNNREIDNFVKGIMIESYLEDGSQMIGNGIYGKSITDACLGWKKTEKLILELADF